MDARDTAIDPIGALNHVHIAEICEASDIIVPCWGSREKLPRQLHPLLDKMTATLRQSGKPAQTFGLSKSGDPLHPLMLGYDTPLVDWEARNG